MKLNGNITLLRIQRFIGAFVYLLLIICNEIRYQSLLTTENVFHTLLAVNFGGVLFDGERWRFPPAIIPLCTVFCALMMLVGWLDFIHLWLFVDTTLLSALVGLATFTVAFATEVCVCPTCKRFRRVTNSVLRHFKRCCRWTASFEDDASVKRKIQ